MRITLLPLTYRFILYRQIRLNDFHEIHSPVVFVNKQRQRRCYNSSTTEFRSISGHYLFHIVCLVFPTYVFVKRFVLLSAPGIVRWFLVSVFPFLSFFSPSPSFFFLLKGMRSRIVERSLEIQGNRYTYLIKDHCRKPSSKEDGQRYFPHHAFGTSIVNPVTIARIFQFTTLFSRIVLCIYHDQNCINLSNRLDHLPFFVHILNFLKAIRTQYRVSKTWFHNDFY